MAEQDRPRRDATITSSRAPDQVDLTESLSTGSDVPRPTELPVVATDHFRIDGERARGGLGRVLTAYDRRLDRTVAIKELLKADETLEARFLREARLTARLQHPAIVPVYETGQFADGKPYYAMKLLEGRTLRELISEAHTVAKRLALLPNVIAVAQAVGYAHSQGIVHRDVKPANVIVGEFGETIVVDWGLAKDLREAAAPPLDGGGPYRSRDSETTACGAILGTPAYMPPEQARGETVDERADVYAIGALLYHTLAGCAPYAATSSAKSLSLAVAGDPVPLERRDPAVPRDLCAIVHKAMRREREGRYRNAGELARDLERFSAGQLVGAQQYSRLGLIGHFVARHRVPVTLSTAFLVLLAIGGAISAAQIVQQKNRAETREHEMILASARSYFDRDPTTTLAWLKRYPVDGADFVAARNLALEAEGAGVAAQVLRPRRGLVSGAFSPDSRLFASQGSQRIVEVRDLTTGAPRRAVAYDGRPLLMLFTPDGERVVWCDESGAGLVVWNWRTGLPVPLPAPGGYSYAIDVAPDGVHAAAGSSDGDVRLFDLVTGAVRVIGKTDGAVTSIAFSADGRELVATGGAAVVVWPLAGGAAARLSADAPLDGVQLSADAERLLAVGADGVVYVWDRRSRRRFALRHPGKVVSARLSADGTRVLSGGSDKIVRLWDVATSSARSLEGHSGTINSLAFTADQTRVVSGSQDGTIRIWDVVSGDSRILRGHSAAVERIKLSPDGHWLASMSLDRSTRIWAMPSDELHVFDANGASVYKLRFLDDDELLSAGTEAPIGRYDVRHGRAQAIGGPASRIARSHDGQLAAVAELDGKITLLSRTGAPRVLVGPTIAMWGLAFSGDDRTLATGNDDGTVRVWDLASGSARSWPAHRGVVADVAYSPDGRWLASAGEDGLVRLWDRAGGADRTFAGHREMASAIDFSPDGKWLASASWDGSVRLWNVASGAVRVLVAGAHRVRMVRFAPDGRTLVAAGDDNVLRLCDVARGSCRALVGHRDSVTAIAFSPDGARLASASSDCSVRLWDAVGGAPLAVHWHRDLARALDFSPDGTRVASGGHDNRARLWRAEATTPIADGRALEAWLATRTAAVLDADQRLGMP
jgi:WD40 repeat protein